MSPDTDLHLDLNLPTGPGLPPPPPMDLDAALEYQARIVADFYASEHYEAWFARTSEEMRNAKPFVWID